MQSRKDHVSVAVHVDVTDCGFEYVKDEKIQALQQ